MMSLISLCTFVLYILFSSGILAIVYGIVTRTWQYLVLAPISIYCSSELLLALNNEIVKIMS
jgi:hypothetical protein